MEPAASLTAFTIRPLDTQSRHGIPAFPLRPGYDRARPESPVPADSPRAAAGGQAATGPHAPSLRARVRAIPGLGDFLAWLAERPQWIREMAGEAAFWGHRFRHMRRTDLVIVAGSNQLSDYFGGPWGFPYAIWAWTLAARVAGARVAILSVGAGPIRSRKSRFFIRGSVSRAFYVSYRDTGSRDAVAAIGVPGPYTLAPDLAYGLRPGASDLAPSPRPASAAPSVLIIPLPHFDPRSWAERDTGVYGRYIDTFATFAVTLLGRGYRVRFAPTQLRVDPPVIADILRAIASRSPSAPPAPELAAPVATFGDLVAHLAESDYVVATRFHGVLISQMLGKPTIGIVYRPSMRGQLVDVGQGAYAVDIADVTAERLLERLQALEQDRGAVERIERRLEEYRTALDAQIRTVLGAGP